MYPVLTLFGSSGNDEANSTTPRDGRYALGNLLSRYASLQRFCVSPMSVPEYAPGLLCCPFQRVKPAALRFAFMQIESVKCAFQS